MKALFKFAKTIRNNWKKSTVGFAVLFYGASYGLEKYKTFQLMRAYCEEAKQYGELCTPKLQKARHITVILNPVAHKKKSKQLYEKYAAPLLHLAGVRVSLITTENAGQAADLMEIMGNTDAVVIAGGNGTLHEAVTGLLRRPEFEENVTTSMPIGILPIGDTNSVAKALFAPWSEKEAQWLAEAAMAIIKESTKYLDVIRVERPEEKPVFALCGLELGDFVDIESNLSKYWYFGSLKDKIIYFYNSFKSHTVVNDIEVEFVPPCEGCSKCHALTPKRKNNDTKRWWTAFIPKVNTTNFPSIDYSKIINENCGTLYRKDSPFSNITISTALKNFCSISHTSDKAFWMSLYPSEWNMKSFIDTGLAYHNGSNDTLKVESIPAREVKLSLKEIIERNCYIDSEPYQIQSMTLSLLPKHLVVYG